MALTPQIEQWLQQAGYEYHCFISWPHTENKEITDCAKYIRDATANGLAMSVPSPKIFLDETSIIAGSDWPLSLRHALCRSIAMVAICAPIYYHPAHSWCGLEWAAMEMLSQNRLPTEPFKTIIPISVRTADTLPNAVSRIQCIDLSSVTIRGRRYYNTQEFKLKVEQIVANIECIATALMRHQAKPNCDAFSFPAASAFADYQPQVQPLPFRAGQ